ncbi:MAG: lipoprotein-releasing ABC transporter permease subunit [Syntrophobacterales bacterium]|nr:lipoprotein-releasing ABC transporter permease subunit [Syntrophobacterales bacterium]OPX41680.1 MAG: ABC transporter permease [Desulfobacteraceae bacterium 4484_190.3]
MSYESFIAFRYLRAKRKQAFVSLITLISIAGIFLGVAALIIVLAVMNGFETDLRNKILGVTSHIVLMKYSGQMEDYENVMKKAETIDGVAASTPFVYGQAMLKSQDGATGVVLRGISTDSVLKVINIGKFVEGSIQALSEKKNGTGGLPGIVIGKELSKNLGLFLNDKVDVLSPMGIPTPMGIVPRIKKFIVVGIFESGFYEYDSSLAFLSLSECQNFLNMKRNVTGVEIRVNDIYKAGDIAERIEKKLGYPYWARNWMQMNKNLFAALRLEKRVMFIILSLIVLVAAFNIITTLIMVVMEKTKDIAILKAMGATSKSIMKIFMLQGIIIGAIGTVLGCIGGVVVALNVEKLSLFIENLFGFKILPGDVYYLSELPSRINYSDVSIIVLATMLICFLATIYPSWKASKFDPAETLRYE